MCALSARLIAPPGHSRVWVLLATHPAGRWRQSCGTAALTVVDSVGSEPGPTQKSSGHPVPKPVRGVSLVEVERMFELSRVRLHSIGPKAARYQDVTLDMSGVGPLLSDPSQDALFGDPGDRPSRRPSPASVLFAENGNGKSVLIKLVFSVMLPGRRQVVGTTSTRVLENFVLAEDVSHVSLEWQHTVTGQRLITGKVSAWQGHVVSSDPAKLREAWYSFRPGPALDLHTLPFTHDGRLVEMTAFREQLMEVAKKHPEMGVLWESGHGLWTEHLDRLGLDAALFAYQRKMNAGEGEAADAFSFRSDEAFVDWLLEAVTDPADAQSLAEVVGNYSSTLAQRHQLMAERDFVSGVLDRLEPLNQASRDEQQAAQVASRASEGLFALSAAVTSKVDALRHTLTVRHGDIETRHGLADAAQQKSTHLQNALRSVEYTIATLRRDDAVKKLEQVTKEHLEATTLVAAWSATDVLLSATAAHQRAQALRGALGDAEAKAAPALAFRDAAAARLVAGLRAVAEHARRVATETDHAAAATLARVQEHSDRANDFAREAERHKAHLDSAQTRVAEITAAIDQAMDAGVLATGDDVSTALSKAKDALAQALSTLKQAEHDLQDTARERAQTTVQVRELERSASNAQYESRRAVEALEQAETSAREFNRSERLTGLLDSMEVDIDKDAGVVVERLSAAIAQHQSERDALRLQDNAVARSLSALGSGGLLPVDDEVQAVVEALTGAGIAAQAGWYHLSQLPAEQRATVIREVPHLIDGVLVANVDDLPSCVNVVVSAGVLPRRAISLGPVTALTDLPAAPGEADFPVVPPNPAMFDDAMAEAERQRLSALRGENTARLRDLDRLIASDAKMLDRIEQWRLRYPVAAIAALRDNVSETARTEDQAKTEVTQAVAAVESLMLKEQNLGATIPHLRDHVQTQAQAVDALTRLVSKVDSMPVLQNAIENGRRGAEDCEGRAREQRDLAERLRTEHLELMRTADDHRRTADQARSDEAEIPGVHDKVATDDSHEDVPSLRAAYREACEAYLRVDIGADLRAELTQAEGEEARSRAAVEALADHLRAQAQLLLSGPEGVDAAARAASASRAQRKAADLDAQVKSLGHQVGQTSGVLSHFSDATEVSCAPFATPTSIEEGEAIAHEAAGMVLEATRAADVARRAAEEAVMLKQDLTAQVAAFEALGERLLDACQVHRSREVQRAKRRGLPVADHTPNDDGPADPFAGSADDAKASFAAVRHELDTAITVLDETTVALHKAVEDLTGYAADKAFDEVKSPVQQQIRRSSRDDVVRHATVWYEALRPRLRSLNDDLDHVGRHRAHIVARLRGLVEVALRTLRSAERVSALPASLHDWGGQKALTIRFADPNAEDLDAALGDVVDEAAENIGQERSSVRRDGMGLLLAGVRAAMPRGVRVDMLKPDPSLRTERVRISSVADVFSGGQLLTAAIILYCTMAALRSNDRGHLGRRHAGVLFLDNPIGRASAGYLLELQLGVAQALGVQLVYTTGLFDPNALSVFPLIIRLRNDRDMRSGMRYLTVDGHVRAALNLPESDGTGRVTSSRVFRVPTDTEPVAPSEVGVVAAARAVESVPEVVKAGPTDLRGQGPTLDLTSGHDSDLEHVGRGGD